MKFEPMNPAPPVTKSFIRFHYNKKTVLLTWPRELIGDYFEGVPFPFLSKPVYGVAVGLTVGLGLELGVGVRVAVGLTVGLTEPVGEVVGVAVIGFPVNTTISNELVSSSFDELTAMLLKVGFNTVTILFTISSKLVRPVTVATVLSYADAFAD